MIKMCSILPVVVVIWVFTAAQAHQTEEVKCEHTPPCKQYLNKFDFKLFLKMTQEQT